MLKNNKISVSLALIFELTTIVSAISSIQERYWKGFLFSLLVIVCLIIPFIIAVIANKKDIMLPSRFIEVGLIFIFLAQYFGELNKFYIKIWWWDYLLHIIFGVYTVMIAIRIKKGIIIKDSKSSIRRFKIFNIINAFSLSLALGTIWEIFEFLGDYFFKANMVKGGLEDTASDLIAHIIASFITCILMYFNSNDE